MTRDMTATALARRADEINDDNLVCDILCNDDERQITVYFAHVDCELDDEDPDAWTVPGVKREVIGATVGADVLTRDELRALIGDRAVEGLEGSPWEYERDAA